MKNYVIRYGLIGATISIAIGIINWYTISQWYGQTVSQLIGWISITLSLMCVPMGIKYYRDKLNNGSVSFGKGFRIGTGIALVASVVIYIYSLLFYQIEGDRFKEWSTRGLSEAELAELKVQMSQNPEFVYSGWFQGLLLAVSVFIIGLIINLISNLVLRKSTI